MQVVSAIADHKNVDPVNLPPLYETFDPDALDRLFSPSSGATTLSGEVSFSIAGCDVVVDSGGDVEVTSAAAAADTEQVE